MVRVLNPVNHPAQGRTILRNNNELSMSIRPSNRIVVSMAESEDAGDFADGLRTRLSIALSDMYRSEVPLYGDLIDIVRVVDNSVLDAEDGGSEQLPSRHQIERHGAIRVGTEQELHTIARLFRIFGMFSVGYYDLSVAGLPLHATAFRPIGSKSLDRNPFRVFTSLLRRDLLSDGIADLVERILRKREAFSSSLLTLIDRHEAGSRLSSFEEDELVSESTNVFSWRARTAVSIDDYHNLQKEHPVLSDVVCFPTIHLNHLTPRTFDIDVVQQQIIERGMPAKDCIEGPPRRKCPILLRQTSFKAVVEDVAFESSDAEVRYGVHSARFGEVEQRGASLTRKGRELYDELLHSAIESAVQSSDSLDACLAKLFNERFPDTWEELYAQSLVFFRYRVTSELHDARPTEYPKLRDLLNAGIISYEPITYEDFLPISAAGIFQSNIGVQSARTQPTNQADSRESELASIIGCDILNPFGLNEKLQNESLTECANQLGVRAILF